MTISQFLKIITTKHLDTKENPIGYMLYAGRTWRIYDTNSSYYSAQDINDSKNWCSISKDYRDCLKTIINR